MENKLEHKEIWNVNKDVGILKNKEFGNTNTHKNITEYIISFTKPGIFLEPAVGTGSFYFAILDMLLKNNINLNDAVSMIYAYDIDINAINILKEKLIKEYGYTLGEEKIFNKDFLLENINISFDYIVSNPPYISSNNINKDKKIEYFEYFKSYNLDIRSDIYIMFFIKTLKLLNKNGKHIFLCSDSWLETGYGKHMIDIFKEKQLEYLIYSNIPFFRDDTNAIITIFSNNNNNKVQIKEITREEVVIYNNKDFLNILNSEISNKKNIIYNVNFFKNLQIIQEKKYEKLSNLIEVESTNISMNTLLKDNIVADKGLYKIFWQIQARINKLPNYKIYIKEEELIYSSNSENNLKQKSTYMSGIIDRFPLIFYTTFPTIHVSKYFYLNSSVLSQLEICLSLNNIFTIFSMETLLKDGTRKTLRKEEMGVTKEIRKKDLNDLYIIDFTKFNIQNRNKISEIGNIYKDKVIYNIEISLQDPEYIKIQNIISEELKINDEEYKYIINETLRMYYTRMRNFKKLNLLLNIK